MHIHSQSHITKSKKMTQHSKYINAEEKSKTIPTNGTPKDLSGGTEVNWTMRRFGVHPLPQEPHVLHLLADQSAGDADLLAPNHHNFLSIEKLFSQNRSEPSQHVMPGVNDDALGADTGTGHHLLVSLCKSLELL